MQESLCPGRSGISGRGAHLGLTANGRTVLPGETGVFTDESRVYAGLSGESGVFTDESRVYAGLSGESGVFTDKVRWADGLSVEKAVFTDKVTVC